MKAENKFILNSFVHGFAQTTAVSIGMSGIISMVKKDKNGNRHPVAGAIRTIIGAGMTYATYVSSKVTSESIIKECIAEAETSPETETDLLTKVSKEAEALRAELIEQSKRLKKMTNIAYGALGVVPPTPEAQPEVPPTPIQFEGGEDPYL